MFHDILKILYKETPGRLKILKNEYTITDEDSDGLVLDKNNWDVAVRPGMQISLNILLKAASSWRSGSCPRCKSHMVEITGNSRRWYVSNPRVSLQQKP